LCPKQSAPLPGGEMKLTVFERIILLNILPSSRDALTMRLVMEMKQKIGFSEAELAALNPKNGQDWSQGCPRCGSKEVGYPGAEMRLSPERTCGACGYQGMSGPGQVFWNTKAPQEAEVELGPRAISIIAERLEELSKNNLVRPEHMSLCDKLGVGGHG